MGHNTENQNYKLLWILFILTAIIGLIEGDSLSRTIVFDSFKLSFVINFIVLIIYSSLTITLGYALFFIFIIFILGLTAEIIGMKYGMIFGGHYIYNSKYLTLFNVPILTLLYWVCFVYIGYTIVSSFLFWNHRDKPNKFNKDKFLLPILIVSDGIVVTALDIFLDPIMTKVGNWSWINGGVFFNVPIGNFLGWFLVTILATGSFRTFEYFFPHKPPNIPKSIYVVSALSYGILCLVFLYLALKLKMFLLAMIGFTVMFPIVIANLIFYVKWKKIRPS